MKKIYFLFIILLLLFAWSFFAWNIINTSKDQQQVYQYDFFVKNHNRVDDFYSDIPFRKNDKISYVFVFEKTWFVGSLDFNFYKIQELMKISNIQTNYNIYERNWWSLVVVELSWDAIIASNTQNIQKSDIKKYIDFKYTDIEYSVVKNWQDLEDLAEKNQQQIQEYNPVEEDNQEATQEDIEDIYEQSTKSQKEELWLTNTNFNVNETALVDIYWYDLDKLSYITIWEVSYPIQEYDWNFFVNIEGNDFEEGSYFAFFVKDNQEILDTNQEIVFSDQRRDIHISDMVPFQVNKETWWLISVIGGWFNDIISIQLSNNRVLENADFDIVSNTTLMLKISNDLDEGEYFLNIMTRENIYELENKTFEIVQN